MMLKNLKSQKIKKAKNFATDMALNIFATITPIFVLQFFLLPLVARKVSTLDYGLMLTLISLITLSVQSFSIALGNSRLLLDEKYKEASVVGDFNILLLISNLINIVVVIVGSVFYEGRFNLINIIVIILISVMQLTRRYLLVAFRLKIEFKQVLYNNIISVIGYLIGMGLFWIFGKWQFIYLTGELLSLIHVISKSNLLKEPLKRTTKFAVTTKYCLVILIASFSGTAIMQMDKLLLYPILGARMVTIYYVATLFGKTLSLLIGPINNVVLTYVSKMSKFKVSNFKILLLSATILGVVSYFIIVFISKPILAFLYPEYYMDAYSIIAITTLTAIVTMITNVINPIIMKFCNITWQIWMNVSNIIIYLVLAYLLVGPFNIYGFCVAALIAALSKLLMIVIIFFNHEKKSKREEENDENIDLNSEVVESETQL